MTRAWPGQNLELLLSESPTWVEGIHHLSHYQGTGREVKQQELKPASIRDANAAKPIPIS